MASRHTADNRPENKSADRIYGTADRNDGTADRNDGTADRNDGTADWEKRDG